MLQTQKGQLKLYVNLMYIFNQIYTFILLKCCTLPLFY